MENESKFLCLLTLCTTPQLLHVLQNLYVLTEEIVEYIPADSGIEETQLVSKEKNQKKEEKNRKRELARRRDELFFLKVSSYALILLLKAISEYSILCEGDILDEVVCHGECVTVAYADSLLKLQLQLLIFPLSYPSSSSSLSSLPLFLREVSTDEEVSGAKEEKEESLRGDKSGEKWLSYGQIKLQNPILSQGNIFSGNLCMTVHECLQGMESVWGEIEIDKITDETLK